MIQKIKWKLIEQDDTKIVGEEGSQSCMLVKIDMGICSLNQQQQGQIKMNFVLKMNVIILKRCLNKTRTKSN